MYYSVVAHRMHSTPFRSMRCRCIVSMFASLRHINSETYFGCLDSVRMRVGGSHKILKVFRGVWKHCASPMTRTFSTLLVGCLVCYDDGDAALRLCRMPRSDNIA